MTRVAARSLRVLLLAALLLTMLVAASPAAHASTTAEQSFVERVNAERASRGLHKLAMRTDLRSVARSHSQTMASQNRLHHNPSLSTDVSNWQRLAENVGRGSSVTSLHSALMNSAGHRANILDARVTEIGVGVVVRDGRMWVTQVFRLPRGATIPTSSGINTFPGGFSDVARSSTHGQDIETLRQRKLTTGCGNNRYCPKNTVTRGQMASFIVRATSGLNPSNSNRFSDVPAGNPHRADINALARAGITTGCNPPRNDRFCPTQPVTRAQMATFMARAMKLPGVGGNRFTDVRGTHTADINALARAGVTAGCNPPSNTRFCPNQAVTRAQMATFLIRGPARR